jgi:hypothetical protein
LILQYELAPQHDVGGLITVHGEKEVNKQKIQGLPGYREEEGFIVIGNHCYVFTHGYSYQSV